VAIEQLAVTTAPRGRNRYLDTLRAVALIRVVTYHATDAGWLSIVFPSMGVMFALAGSLMAASLDRRPPWTVVRQRLRRLLLPFWLFAAVVVVAMFRHGWTDWRPDRLVFWLLPIADPPGTAWAEQVIDPLWYVRAYVWFVLLSPVLLWAYRRWPVATLLMPLLLVGATAVGALDPEWLGLSGPAVLDFGAYGACWLLGFAHRDGSLRRAPLTALIGLAGGAVLLGLAWALVHPDPDSGYDLNEIPLGQALFSVGVVLLLLRPRPQLAWLARVPVLDRLVTLLNARAVTVYLWHEVALVLAVPVNDRLGLETTPELLTTAWVLIGIAVLALGWVEDLAAGRRLRLLPWSRDSLTRVRDSAAESHADEQRGAGGHDQQAADPAHTEAGEHAPVLSGGGTGVADDHRGARDLA
jgi:peptidoglycan-N-acetylglucosamine deacetylase